MFAAGNTSGGNDDVGYDATQLCPGGHHGIRYNPGRGLSIARALERDNGDHLSGTTTRPSTTVRGMGLLDRPINGVVKDGIKLGPHRPSVL